MIESDLKIESTHHSNTEKCRSVIKLLLAQNNINVTELARRVNLPQPTIHRLLTGKTEDPKLSTLSIIANYFSVSVDQLLGHTPLGQNSDIKSSASTLIPIISWQEATNYKAAISDLSKGNKENWILVDTKSTPPVFGLNSKRCTELKFPTGTILLIDPTITPSDGDLVIVHYPHTSEATIRELTLDGPKQALTSFVDNSQSDVITKDIKLIGVITQTRYYYK